MAHSVPAAVLAGLLVFTVADRLGFGDVDAFLLGISVVSGYLVHLVLDELYAMVDFEGRRFAPNRSLGSSLKFSSPSRWSTILAYMGIIALSVGNGSRLRTLAGVLWERVS